MSVQPRTWRTLPRHPLSKEYADLPPRPKADMVAGLKEFGIIDGRKVTLAKDDDGKMKVLDGWQLLQACIEANVKPLFATLAKRIPADKYVELKNDVRRHESQEKAQERIDTRRERVAGARSEGQSIRTIAEQEGVDPATVHRDLSSGVAGATPELPNGKITGKDGKTYEATKKPKFVEPPDFDDDPEPAPVLCSRCQRNIRTGQKAVKGCPECKALNPKPKKGPTSSGGSGSKPASDLPKSVQNALADTWHAECARTLAGMAKQCKGAFGWSSWLDGSVLDHLKAAEEYFLTAIPKKACPDCKGQKKIDKEACKRCRGGGYLASQE